MCTIGCVKLRFRGLVHNKVMIWVGRKTNICKYLSMTKSAHGGCCHLTAPGSSVWSWTCFILTLCFFSNHKKQHDFQISLKICHRTSHCRLATPCHTSPLGLSSVAPWSCKGTYIEKSAQIPCGGSGWLRDWTSDWNVSDSNPTATKLPLMGLWVWPLTLRCTRK